MQVTAALRSGDNEQDREHQVGDDVPADPFSSAVRSPPVVPDPNVACISIWSSQAKVLELLVMELHQLEYFVAVAEEASFTRAANRVHVAQPGVSAQVRRLESELGQQLLDRSGRSVRLTEVGTAVLPFARAALSAVANAKLAVAELAGLVRGQVTVGMVSGCALPVLAELLAGFHDLYPGVSITLTEDNSDRLIELLREGRLDLALIGSAGHTAPGVETAVLVQEELVAVMGSGHPLAASAAVTVSALRDLPLVSLPRGTGVRAALDAACARAGFTPLIVFEASALPMVAQLAIRGLGVAIVPASAATAVTAPAAAPAPAPSAAAAAAEDAAAAPATAPAGATAVPITSPEIRSRLELAWNSARPANPAARALAEHAQGFVRQLTAQAQPTHPSPPVPASR
jgi:DNA-binding transcriptional LysR family regulator